MAYKQPRVPPMKEETKLAEYIRELVLFLKDFSLETWMAVRTMQGAQTPQTPQGVTPEQVQAMLSEQAQSLRQEMAQSAAATQQEIAEAAAAAKKESIDSALPVGIVVKFATQTDPNALYPWQQWTQITDGRVEIAAGDAYPLGSTGGEAAVTLAIEEMPAHQHNVAVGSSDNELGAVYDPWSLIIADGCFQSLSVSTQRPSAITAYTGGGTAHNNMQPYVARNVWQRTA